LEIAWNHCSCLFVFAHEGEVYLGGSDMKPTIAMLLCLFVAAPLVSQNARPRKAANQAAGAVVIVFKDGHRQTIQMSQIARIEFSQPELTADAASNQALPGRRHFIGKWKVFEGAGMNRVFYATLKDDGSAEKTIGTAHGTWQYVNGEAHISWDDGWHDIIRKVGGKHEKVAFQPGTTFSDQPLNVSDAQPMEQRPL
jgi:hypothetical protein